jgi:hypothetical protein
VELDKTYVDVSNAVNARVIGIFASGSSSVTGESWFLQPNLKRQTLRQVYVITGAGSYPHGINLNKIFGFTRIWGTFRDSGGTWYPLPYVDVASATNQVSILVNSTNIVITAGGGTPPSIASGTVALEWMA